MRRFLLLALLASAVAFGQEDQGFSTYPKEGVDEPAVVTGVTPEPPPVKPGQLLTFWRWEDTLTDEIVPLTGVWIEGTASYAAGMDGRAVVMDNSNHYIFVVAPNTTVGDDANDDFSFSFWVYKGDPGANGFFIDRSKTAPFAYDWFIDWTQANLRTRFDIYDSSGGIYRADGDFGGSPSEWQFFAGTWDDSEEEGILYTGFDGGALGETVASEIAAWTGPRRKGADRFRIQPFTSGGNVRCDEFRYWKVELKRNDIDKLYAAGPP